MFSIICESVRPFWTADPNVGLNMCTPIQRCHPGQQESEKVLLTKQCIFNMRYKKIVSNQGPTQSLQPTLQIFSKTEECRAGNRISWVSCFNLTLFFKFTSRHSNDSNKFYSKTHWKIAWKQRFKLADFVVKKLKRWPKFC